jgi:hypothetical protein
MLEDTHVKYFDQRVEGVTSAQELCDLVKSFIFFDDDSDSDSDDECMTPRDFMTFIWEHLSDLQGLGSYTQIGEDAGYSYYVIRQFLLTHVSPTILCNFIDKDFSNETLYPYGDIVLVDMDIDENKNCDWDDILHLSKIIIFHNDNKFYVKKWL